MNPMASLTMYDALTMLVSGFLWCSLLLAGEQEYSYQSVMFWLICYTVGLVYHRFLDFVSENCKCLRNNPEWIKKAHDKVQEENSGNLGTDSSKQAYYAAYYHLVKNHSLGNIPVLEAQVAFIRDIVPVLIVYVIGAFGFEFGIWKELEHSSFTRYEIAAFLLFVILLLIVTRFVSQNKIYELVWEGSCFINDQEGNKEN